MNKININFRLNGKEVSIDADPRKRLVDLLRDDFKLKGVKEGCAEGECGACTVILDGETVTSCLLFAPQANGHDIVTIEGILGEDYELHPIQEALVEAGAVQCGFCTPAMVLSAKALLDVNPDPTVEEIQTAISGNLCRCTGYAKIIEGIQTAADRMRTVVGVYKDHIDEIEIKGPRVAKRVERGEDSDNKEIRK